VTVTVTPRYRYEVTPFRWRTIAGNDLGVGDDSTKALPSPFLIQFAGQSSPTVYVSANGFLNFHGYPVNVLSAFHEPLPIRELSTGIYPFIFPWWMNLYPIAGSAQNVVYAVMGTAQNRELIIEWRDVQASSCRGDSAATVTFHVVLREGSHHFAVNYVDVHFGDACSDADGGGAATIGVQTTKQLATQLSYNTARLQDHMTVEWIWPGYIVGSIGGSLEVSQRGSTRWPTIPHIPDPESSSRRELVTSAYLSGVSRVWSHRGAPQWRQGLCGFQSDLHSHIRFIERERGCRQRKSPFIPYRGRYGQNNCITFTVGGSSLMGGGHGCRIAVAGDTCNEALLLSTATIWSFAHMVIGSCGQPRPRPTARSRGQWPRRFFVW